MSRRIISPELENDELGGEGPFYICSNCGQVISRDSFFKSQYCPNCEFAPHIFNMRWLAISLETARWWFSNTDGWMKTTEDIGIEDLEILKES